jgi:hypothetical protein
MDEFEMYAEAYPILIDLVGIAAQMALTSATAREVVLDYMSNIIKPLDVNHDYVIAELGKVLGLQKYYEVTA